LKDKKLTYKEAGVDTEKASRLVDFIKEKVKKAFNYEGIGGFASGLPLKGYKKPVILTTTDGVGTKLLIAQEVNRHREVGVDLVAMNVNDLVTTGAEPLLFLDYVATGKLELPVLQELIEGIVEGCKEGEVLLAGGETAEMPDFYPPGRYDLAGFCVGVCEEEELITGKEVKEGDLLLGLPSSGFHSNGFSLVRKVLKLKGVSYHDAIEELGLKVWEALLIPTRIYAKEVKKLKKEGVKPKAMVHVTGGGIPENLPRVLPKGLRARVFKKSIPPNPLFDWIRKLGSIEEGEMFKTFNMGVGFIFVVDPSQEGKVKELLPDAFTLGLIEKGEGVVIE